MIKYIRQLDLKEKEGDLSEEENLKKKELNRVFWRVTTYCKSILRKKNLGVDE